MTMNYRSGSASRIIILALVVLGVVGAFMLRGGKGDGVADTAMDAKAGAATAEDTGLPVLLDLGADKCVPCKMMVPVLDELEHGLAGKLEVRFLDVWKHPAEAKKYGIQLIPTQIFFDADGKELFRHEGFFARDEILAKWRELGYEFTLPAGEKG